MTFSDRQTMRACVARRAELKKYWSSSGGRKTMPDGNLDRHKGLERSGNGKYDGKNKSPLFFSFKKFLKNNDLKQKNVLWC